MSIRFLKGGLQTSLQDLGRTGFRRYGIPNNGALDPVSLQIANWLVSKPLDAACLEITLSGPVLEFTQELAIAVTGAHFELLLNDQSAPMHQTLFVKKGDQLQFGKLLNGARAYLAFSAQPDLPKIMGSHSTNLMAHFGGFNGRAFINDDTLELTDSFKPIRRQTPARLKLTFGDNYLIRFVTGRNYSSFNLNSQQAFQKQAYHATSQSNRMGMRLKGVSLTTQNDLSITTAPITAGTIQVPPDGQPIITLGDGQTTGGYLRIGQVISVDLAVLGQLKANDSISFQPMDVDDATKLLIQKTKSFERLLQ